MIFCDHADASIDLMTSGIKFLSYVGLRWSAPVLPLQITPLGDLMQVNLKLATARGDKIPCQWDGIHLHAPFDHQHIYQLDLRLEYQAPFAIAHLAPDFTSIQPASYRFSVTIREPQSNQRVRFRWPPENRWLEVSPDTQLEYLKITADRGIWNLSYNAKHQPDHSFPLIELDHGGA